MRHAVYPAALEVAKALHRQLPEFTPGYLAQYPERTEHLEHHAVLVSYETDRPAGYLVLYEDGADAYCWMTGVLPAFRRRGHLRALMRAAELWARERDFPRLKLKTRNSRREMLTFLVQEGWMFTEVELHDPVEESRVVAIKPLT